MNTPNPNKPPFLPPALTPEQWQDIFAKMSQAIASHPKRVTDPLLMDYHDQYLKCALWKRIKKRILERDQNICQCCGGRGTIVHHRSYESDVLLGKNDSMLAIVCTGCHSLIHITDDGRKRTVEETEIEFLVGQRQTETPEIIKVNLRNNSVVKIDPPSWGRPTSMQTKLWIEKYLAALRSKREALEARKKSRIDKLNSVG